MKKITAIVLAMLLMLSLAACSGQDGSGSGAAGNNGGSAAGGEKTISDPNGRDAFDAILAENDVTLVTVLASWSTPCETVIPTLQQISADMKKVGVVAIIADSVDEATFERSDDIMAYVAELMKNSEADFTVVSPDKELYSKYCEPTEFYPTSYVVNAQGEILAPAIVAAGDAESFTEALNDALAAAAAAQEAPEAEAAE